MSATPIPPALSGYDAMTAHVRLAPYTRRFAYKLAQIFIDVDAPEAAAHGLKFFAVNRPALFSFYTRDHGDRSGAPLRAWVEQALASIDVHLEGGAIRLLTFPRILGFVFNPISVFFGYGPDGRLKGVVYEVNNTFGETHAYVALADPNADVHAHAAPKRFHVSPFMDVVGAYQFRISPPSDTFYLFIENRVDGARTHLASLLGRRVAMSDRWLMGVFLRMPLMTLGVVAGIHWEALWIWLRGGRYHDKPALPLGPTTPAAPSAPAADLAPPPRPRTLAAS
jgi:uncharacterized protein